MQPERKRPGPADALGRSWTVIPVPCALRAPLDGTLGRTVQSRLRVGERRIALDLARLSEIDAAGVGELVRVFNATIAAGGVLQIFGTRSRVRRLLHVAGLLQVLSGLPSDPRS